MTKDQLQAELKAKVKEGVKPSHLKRSKSLGDIPNAPPAPSLTNELTTLQTENEALKKQISELEKEEVFVEAPEENINELKEQLKNLEQQILELRLSKINEFGEYYQQKQELEKLLQKEFTTLKEKITTKLQVKDQAITDTNQKLQESNQKLELSLKENTENEKALEQLLKEFKELSQQLA
ncbi:6411_t:CDS:2 [Ambispora gerdemannii]|uniref:6411_t:CDS:1 n=1 Tax=Ambispora gerdemannii TaxID=144530 RepID=A0A9N9GP63_9GLOM|nr:6411_t:CDS:2 [Ambispora gerdemannii]